MKHLQKWFDLMAGIHEEEQQKELLARQIFCHSTTDTAALQMPACWRRARLVR